MGQSIVNGIRRWVLVCVVAAGLAPCAAVAQTTWLGSGTDANWNTANNWSTGLGNNFSSGLVFAGSTQLSNTNTLTGGTATSIAFNSGAGAFSLSGNSIVLTGSIANLSTSLQTINLGLNLTRTSTITLTAGGGNVVLAGPIGQVSGSTGALRIVNAGTVTLSGSNSYGGDTTMATSGQTIVIGNNNALGLASGGLNFSAGSGSIDVTTGGSFSIANNITNINGATTFVGSGTGSLATTGTFTFGGANRTLTVSSGTFTVAQIDAAGSGPTTRVLTKSGNGTLVVTGSAGSNFQGGMTLDGGLTIFGDSAAMGQGVLTLGSGTMSSIGNLTISNTVNVNPSSATTIAGTSSITFQGQLSNANSGPRTLSNNLDRTSAVLTIGGPVLVSTGGVITFGGSGNTIISGTISGTPISGTSINITSTGTTTLSGVNTHSGTTNFNSAGGTLVLGNDAALGSSVLRVDTSTGTVSASPAFTATNAIVLFTDVIFGGTNSMTFGAAVNGQNNARGITNNLPAGKTLTFSGTTTIRGAADGTSRVFTVGGAGNTTFNDTIVDGGGAGSGGLTITSTGTTTLAVANTYTGTTTVSAGVLMLSNTGALGSSGLRIDTGGVIGLNAGDFTRSSGTGAGQVQIPTSGGFAAFGADRIVALGGTAAPTALTWASGGFLGTSGTFFLGAPGATHAVDFRNNVALGATVATAREVRVDDGGAAIEAIMSGTLTGASGLRKSGAGTLRLTAANTFTGTTSITAGVLQLGNSAALGSSALDTSGAGTLSFEALTSATFGSLVGSGNLVLTNTASQGVALTVGSGTYSGTMSGAGSFTKAGAGTFAFNGVNTSSGGVTLAGGRLNIGNAQALGSGPFAVTATGTIDNTSGSPVTVTNNLNLAANAAFVGTNPLTIDGTTTLSNLAANTSGTITVSGGTLALGSIAASGANAATSGMTKAGAGALAITGPADASFTGGFTQNAGLLVLGDDTALGTGTFLIVGGTVRASSPITLANTVSATSTMVFTGTSLTLQGNLGNLAGANWTVTNNVDAGSTLTFAGTTSLRAPGSTSGGTWTIAGTGNTTYSGPITNGGVPGGGANGNAGITVTNTGITTLSASNSYTNHTTVQAGVLLLSNSNAVPGGIGAVPGAGSLMRIDGGVVGLGAGDFGRPLGNLSGSTTVSISGSFSAGFAAYGANQTRVVDLGGAGAAVTWGANSFMTAATGSTFQLGATSADGTVEFRNPINLGASGNTRNILVENGAAAVDAIMSGSLSNAANLTKRGLGTLQLTGVNSFTGTAAIQAGTLEITATSGLRDSALVAIDGGATFRYSGSTATFARPITVTAASGTGTIENTGSGVLTLSGAISKDNSVLRLSSGTFNVTGVISGATPNASDLLVTGTSTVTLSNVNTYDGPTFVNQSSNLILGVTGAIPNNSIVTVGDATTTGTLTLGAGVTNAIGGLAFGDAGGTLRISATSTSGAPLTTPGTMTLADGTLDLADSGSTAGLYNVLSGGVVTGTFTSVTNSSPAYQLIYSSTAVDYQQRAVAGTVNVTNPAVAIITGGTAAFTYTVTNPALAGGATLSFTGSGASNVGGSSSGSVAAGGTSSAVAGLFYNGVSTGSNQTGTFTVSDPNAYGTAATGTVTVNVYAHASGSAAGATIALPQSIVGYSGALSGLTSATISNAAGYRANLMTTGGTSAGFVGINNVAGVLPGDSALISAAALLSGSQAVGANSLGQVFNLTFADDSNLSGASNSLGSQSITVTGDVLDHSLPGFVPTANITDSYTQTTLNIDFGAIDQTAGMQTFNYFLTNLSSQTYGQALTAGLAFTSVTADGDGFSSGLTTFSNLAAGGTSSQFAFTYTPSGAGTFNKTFTLTFYDNQSLAGSTQRRDLTINAQVIVVPEPATFALAAAGVGMALLARARRRRAA